ncbi:MAG: sensor histidine kinase [Flavobacteriaceae bacterium]
MKFTLIYVLTLLVCFNILEAQIDVNLRKIDSIHKNVFNYKIKDSATIAKVDYQLGELFRYSLLSDSSYYYYHKAEKIFKALEDNYNYALTLYGIAVIQTYEKDYTGSEVTSFEAIALLDELEETNDVKKYKSFIFNNLGIVFHELGLHEESIKYYKQAINLKNTLKGNFKSSIDNSINNLAKGYSSFGKFDLATETYNKILYNKNLIKERPDFYALVLDNYAYTLYQSKKLDKLPELFLKALKISDSINYQGYNSIIINQHLAEYYNDNNQKDSALYYAYRAKDISEQYHNDDLLKSLKLLSEIEDGAMSAKHLNDYVKLSDSLQKVERATRNKYARIRFETNQIEQENVEIARERMWLFIISIVIIIASLLLYIVINQRNKNKELKFIQQQQENNEEIYNLMLSKNESIEEARTIEKQRISGELHDGVLGRLFGTRLSLDSLNMSNTDEAIKTRGQYIADLKAIEEDIRKVSHELNTDFVSGSGFIDIIKTLVETQTKVYGLEYNLDYQDVIDWESVSNKTKIHIYRIIQENLHNIYKHANATRVNINFKLNNDKICLTLSDDGSGFNVDKVKSGIGLKNMNSRINEINGKIYITSTFDVGTTVIIKIPITQN